MRTSDLARRLRNVAKQLALIVLGSLAIGVVIGLIVGHLVFGLLFGLVLSAIGVGVYFTGTSE